MRILEIIPSLGSGGAETFVKEISNALVKKGHSVTILTFYDDCQNISCTINSQIKREMLKKKQGTDLSLFFRLLSFVNKGKYDIVHSHSGAIKYTLLLPLFCKKTRYFSTIHSEAKREAGNIFERNIKRFLFKLNLCEAVTISKESESSFFDFYKKHAPIVLNGVSEYHRSQDFKGIEKNHEEIVFFHAASCQKVKNQERLFKAFNSLLPKYPNIKLVWAGNTEIYHDLFLSLKPLLNDRIEYIGVINNPRDYMNCSDAFCLSSDMEGLPMTILEAFSVGCPTLCTPVGGCVNVIQNGVNGFLSDGMSVEDYANMLRKFIDLGEEEKAEMRQKALESYTLYSIDNTVDGYLELFQK